MHTSTCSNMVHESTLSSPTTLQWQCPPQAEWSYNWSNWLAFLQPADLEALGLVAGMRLPPCTRCSMWKRFSLVNPRVSWSGVVVRTYQVPSMYFPLLLLLLHGIEKEFTSMVCTTVKQYFDGWTSHMSGHLHTCTSVCLHQTRVVTSHACTHVCLHHTRPNFTHIHIQKLTAVNITNPQVSQGPMPPMKHSWKRLVMKCQPKFKL